jgi:hypothetical protein
MNRDDYVFALSEREQVKKLLGDMPSGFSLAKISLESRLKKIEKILSNAEPRQYEATKATLTFRGPTVMGTHGISASFGTKALTFFDEAIAYVASAFNGSLPSAGKVPNSEQNHLMITSSARGSFGFILEEFRPDAPLGFDEPTLVSKALDKTQLILQASLDGNDEQLAEALEDLDERALEKIRSFISFLVDNKTVFTLKSNGFDLVFSEPKQLEGALKQLSPDNIKEELLELDVFFLGVLPNKRQCEFIIEGDTDVKSAKIDKGFADPNVLNKHLSTPARAKFARKIIGNGKPRFTLLTEPSWK